MLGKLNDKLAQAAGAVQHGAESLIRHSKTIGTDNKPGGSEDQDEHGKVDDILKVPHQPLNPGPTFDYVIVFQGAEDLKAADIVTSDPYLEAYLGPPEDPRTLKFTTGVEWCTLKPVWNARWELHNVPDGFQMTMKITDKSRLRADTPIGEATLILNSHEVVEAGNPTKNHVLDVWLSNDKKKGRLMVQTTCTPSKEVPGLGSGKNGVAALLSAGGPTRYAKYTSIAAGIVTGEKALAFHTYHLRLYHLLPIFGADPSGYQHWNVKYDAAQRIFAENAEGRQIRSALHAQHTYLYRDGRNTVYGEISDGPSLAKLWHGHRLDGPTTTGSHTTQGIHLQLGNHHYHSHSHPDHPSNKAQSIASQGDASTGSASNLSTPGSLECLSDSVVTKDLRLIVFTYSITPDGMFVSETGTDFFQDFMSKHAMHADRATEVIYSGELRLFQDAEKDGAWTLWIDNNSGTYAPNKDLLPKLEDLFLANFSDLVVKGLEHEDERLVKIREMTKKFNQEQTIAGKIPKMTLFGKGTAMKDIPKENE